MMNKVKAKLLWLWEKVKKYWYLLLFGLVAVYALAFAKNKDALIDNMMRERDAILAAHNTRIQEIQAGVEQERKRREEIEVAYSALVKNIDETKNQRAQEILAANKTQLKELIERNQNNPQEMANSVNRVFGVTIITVPSLPVSSSAELPANPY